MSGATCRSIGSPALAVTLPAWVILINGAGGTYDGIAIMCFYPKTEEGWEELGKRVATARANYVIEKIERQNCPTWQELELYQAVIDTYYQGHLISPRSTRNPAGSPAGKQSPTLNIGVCSDQARSDSVAMLSVGLFVLHIAERPYRNCSDGAAEIAF